HQGLAAFARLHRIDRATARVECAELSRRNGRVPVVQRPASEARTAPFAGTAWSTSAASSARTTRWTATTYGTAPQHHCSRPTDELPLVRLTCTANMRIFRSSAPFFADSLGGARPLNVVIQRRWCRFSATICRCLATMMGGPDE